MPYVTPEPPPPTLAPAGVQHAVHSHAERAPARHLVAVWDPAREPDAMEATLGTLLTHVRARPASEDDVYVWWGKIRSPNRQQPMAHLGAVLALDAAAASGDEVHLYLTDYRALYVAYVGEVTTDDPRTVEGDAPHVPAGLYPPDVACDCWFRLFDVRRLVEDDTQAVVAELKKLRNLGYHRRPVSLYGGMVDLPLVVEREDGARWFDRGTRARLTDGRPWVQFDAELSGVGAVTASLRDDVLGEACWGALDSAARVFVATAEKVWREHRGDAGFDFSAVVVNFAKAYEVQLGLLLGALRGGLPAGAGLVNLGGRTADALDGTHGLGALGRAFAEDYALRRALPLVVTHARWAQESLGAVLTGLAEARNAAAHGEVTTREAARRVRDGQLGVGMAAHLVELARVRVVTPLAPTRTSD